MLAYHYITEGHLEAAISQLKDVTQLQPKDLVAAQLLRQLQQVTHGTPVLGSSAPAPAPAAAGATPASGITPASATVKEGNLVGTWTAEPSADTAIRLNILGGGRFNWKVTSQGKTQEYEGDETYGNGVLTLARSAQDAQPPLVGRLNWRDEDHFSFKILAGPSGDPGLSFTRLP